MKLIIYCGGNPVTHGHKRGEFLWSEIHQCYIWQGREYDESEFNSVVVKAMTDYRKYLQPLVKVLDAVPLAPPVVTISAREITPEMAVEVLARLAPDRLKAKPGPKPKIQQAG